MLQRLLTVLTLCVALVAGGLITALALRPQPGLNADQVKAIVADALASRPAAPSDDTIKAIVDTELAARPAPTAGALPQSVAALDSSTIGPMIEDYMMKNPDLLTRVNAALDVKQKAEQAAQTKQALADEKSAIYDDPDHIVLGNPNGDVTLVEMFDYNCTYCRQSLPDLATLIDSDKNLKVILKEFPILSQGSVDAAHVAVLVNRQKPADYWQFHEALYTSRGQVTKDTALKAASDLGLSPVQLELKMNEPDITAVVDKNYDIAKKLGINGTPSYIIGNEIIPGAIDLAQLQQRIANMRACGETTCPAPASTSTGNG